MIEFVFITLPLPIHLPKKTHTLTHTHPAHVKPRKFKGGICCGGHLAVTYWADVDEYYQSSSQSNKVRNHESNTGYSLLTCKFYPNSLDFIRQLQRWIGGIDWWRWLVKCQLARNFWTHKNIWTSNWYRGCNNPRSGGTVVRARSSRSHLGASGKAIFEQARWPQISVVTHLGPIIDQYSLPTDT